VLHEIDFLQKKHLLIESLVCHCCGG